MILLKNKSNYYISKSSISAIIGLILLLLTFYNKVCQDILSYRFYFSFLALMCFVVCFTGLYYWRRHMTVFSFSEINAVDIFVFIFILYGSINISFKGDNYEPLIAIKWLSIIVIYFIFRLQTKRSKVIVMYFIIISGLVQCVMCLLQFASILTPNNSIFPITGSFTNPGHVGGYLAVSFSLAVSLLVNNKEHQSKNTRMFLAISAVMILGVILMSKSRAALLACAIAAIIIFYQSAYYGKCSSQMRCVFTFVAIVITLSSIVALYSIRPKSANSRVLIWRIGIGMIKDKPIFGGGVASFRSSYMYKQAEYFKIHKDSKFTLIANNNYQSFNEFIHITCEQGIVGLVILLSILFAAFFQQYSSVEKPALAALITVSCFLYVSDIPPILIMFPVLLALPYNAEKHRNIDLKRSKHIPLLLVTVAVSLAIVSFYIKEKYDIVRKDIISSYKLEWPLIKRNDKEYALMLHNKDFALRYASVSQEFGDVVYAINTLEDVRRYMPTGEMLSDLGDLYAEKGNERLAISNYWLAHYMIPSRIIPLYKLFLFYKKRGDIVDARRVAKIIISQHYSKVGSIVLRAKHEAKIYYFGSNN